MKTISIFDKLLLLMGLLIVIAIFTLAYVIAVKGGMCVINPLNYAIENNLTKDFLIIPRHIYP